MKKTIWRVVCKISALALFVISGFISLAGIVVLFSVVGEPLSLDVLFAFILVGMGAISFALAYMCLTQ